MKSRLVLGGTLVVVSIAFHPTLTGGAKQGASLYKTKCAGCHGTKGEGKPAVRAPALKGTSLTSDELAQHILKGEPSSKAPHNKGIAGVTDAEAKSIAEFLKALK